MGFFKDLVDDNSEADGKNAKTEKDKVSELDKIFDMSGFSTSEEGEPEAVAAEAADDTLGQQMELFDNLADGQEQVDEALLENLFDPEAQNEDIIIEDEPQEIVEEDAGADTDITAADTTDSDQVTVITKGTTINGSIVSDCSLNVMGTINGDIECIGKLTISGSVVGNSVASDVYVNAKRLDGNIDSEGTVKIGLGTVVIGDIKAGSAVIAGAVKGELDVKGPVIIDSTAIIKGNIKSKSVQMNNGAVLEGFCSLAYADVDIDDIFE